MDNTPGAPNLEPMMCQASQTPLTTDVVEAPQQKPTETTCCFDLPKHRLHDHLASGGQGLAFRPPHFRRPAIVLRIEQIVGLFEGGNEHPVERKGRERDKHCQNPETCTTSQPLFQHLTPPQHAEPGAETRWPRPRAAERETARWQRLRPDRHRRYR